MSTRSREEQEFEKFWSFSKVFGEPCFMYGERGTVTTQKHYMLHQGGVPHLASIQLFWPMRIIDQLYTPLQAERIGDMYVE